MVVSSRTVADDFGKRHADVLRDIENIKTQSCAVTTMFLESSYKAGTGKAYKEYLLTRDGFSLLVMGFTGAKADVLKKIEQKVREFGERKIA